MIKYCLGWPLPHPFNLYSFFSFSLLIFLSSLLSIKLNLWTQCRLLVFSSCLYIFHSAKLRLLFSYALNLTSHTLFVLQFIHNRVLFFITFFVILIFLRSFHIKWLVSLNFISYSLISSSVFPQSIFLYQPFAYSYIFIPCLLIFFPIHSSINQRATLYY